MGKLECMHAICLHAWAYISAKLSCIRKMKVSIELGEHTRPIWIHNTTQASQPACIHTMYLSAWAHKSAKLEWIIEIKVSMESGEQAQHTRPIRVHNTDQAHKLTC